jgi:serine-type D-Ala-D-Ala carboxypeptidase (penicillin-binding protein 5/6)
VLVVVLVALGYVAFALVPTVPGASIVPLRSPGAFAGAPLRLAWPSQGEAAIGVQGVGLIGVRGSRRPTPIASVAKVMSAYLVLRDHPLHGHAGGPRITVTAADVAVYRHDLAAGQSVVAVRAGEHLTEREALEGLLLPSGNNMATMLAGWDARSQGAFVAKMNEAARTLGLAHTHYTDPSGVASSTVSTALDQVRLAMRAMRIPAFAQTVAMTQATLPVAGRQYNKDALLGQHGIVGIKTGTTSQAGGCFVFAAHEHLARRSITVVGAVLRQIGNRGVPSIIAAAFHTTTILLASTARVVKERRVLRRGATIARMKPPWADAIALRATRSASLLGWPGLRVHTTIAARHNASGPIKADQDVGIVVLAAGEQRDTVRLTATRSMPGAPLAWRLTHP